MCRRVKRTVAAAVPALLLLSVLSGHASERRFVEDFSTRLYEDTLNTTAWWDTVAGEVKPYPFAPTLVGSYDTPGSAYGVAVAGERAYVADYYGGLHVIDIGDPASPLLMGTLDTPGRALAVAVAGDRAYVADWSSGLAVVDVSDPAVPALLGTCSTGAYAYGVAVSGRHAFLVGTSGLQVIDISDPANPTLVGSCATPELALSVAVAGDLAFVADGSTGLQVMDVSDVANPTLLGAWDSPGFAYGVDVSGRLAFVADMTAGLQVIDVGNPASPALIGTYDTPDRARAVAVSGTMAYVADMNTGLLVVDVSDSSAPVLALACDTPGVAYGLAVDGTLACMADQDLGIQNVTVNAPSGPVLLGSCGTTWCAEGVAVSGTLACVANMWGMEIIDVTDPLNPARLGGIGIPAGAVAVAVAGRTAYTVSVDRKLRIISVADPANPVLLGSHDTVGMSRDVAVSGTVAYVADAEAGLRIVDVGNPASPVLLGTCDTDFAEAVAIAGTWVYVADRDAGLKIIDASNPASPIVVGSHYAAGRFVLDVAVSGTRAFYVDGVIVGVLDVSVPSTPLLIGGETCYGSVSVAVAGNVAHVAYDDPSGLERGGLFLVGLEDPTAPSPLGSWELNAYTKGVAAAGLRTYLTATCSSLETTGLFVLETSQYRFDLNATAARSLPVVSTDAPIVRVRLTPDQQDSVTWWVSSSGGVDWSDGLPASWARIAEPGADLRWRADLAPVPPYFSAVAPAVSRLEIDWLFEAANVDSIVDVPSDQGGWVLAHFARSGRDFADEAIPVASYGIWRRVDCAALSAAVAKTAVASVGMPAPTGAPDWGGLPVVTHEGQPYLLSRFSTAAQSFPPGTWAWVATVPALQQDTYIAAVPTAADSSAAGPNPTVLVLTAHTTTPSVWYVSEPDSGWSVDNLAPHVPGGFAVAYGAGGNALSWEACPDADFEYFRVYRGTTPDFVPAPENLAHVTVAAAWVDPEPDSWDHQYKVTALDHAGNESPAASPGTVTGLEDGGGPGGPGRDGADVPSHFALLGAAPNPFNPETMISFALPRPERVRLTVYDLSGRTVRVLVDEPRPAGTHAVRWDGKGDGGRLAASGVYVCRMEAGTFRAASRVALVK